MRISNTLRNVYGARNKDYIFILVPTIAFGKETMIKNFGKGCAARIETTYHLHIGFAIWQFDFKLSTDVNPLIR